MIKEFAEIYKSLNLSYEEILSEIYFVLELEFGLKKQDILMGKILTDNNFLLAKNIFEKRVNTGMPTQYIIHKAPFMGDIFYCDKNVLIPRDDTQILVEKAIEVIKKNNLKTVLDIGTGSGIIAIEIAKHTNAHVSACDISNEALSVAKKNAQNLGIDISFITSDLFQNINDKFDLIVSNPPYIPVSQKDNLQNEVKKFEPQLALFAGDDGLDFYTKITSEAQTYLEDEGFLIYEIGIFQSEAIKNIMKNNFDNIFIEKDVAGIERVIGGQLKS